MRKDFYKGEDLFIFINLEVIVYDYFCCFWIYSKYYIIMIVMLINGYGIKNRRRKRKRVFRSFFDIIFLIIGKIFSVFYFFKFLLLIIIF